MGRDYGHGHNGSILRRSDLFAGTGCRIELDSADGLIRLMRGTDVRCPHCDQLEFNNLAERAIIWFGLQKSEAYLVRRAAHISGPQGRQRTKPSTPPATTVGVWMMCWTMWVRRSPTGCSTDAHHEPLLRNQMPLRVLNGRL